MIVHKHLSHQVLILLLGIRTVWCLSSTPPPTTALTPIQSTSLLVAYWRDLETKSSSPLIRDEPASVLLDSFLSDADKIAYDTSPIRQIGWNVLAVRTRLLDDWRLYKGIFSNQKETKEDDETVVHRRRRRRRRQIVVLGAGMCTRPYRLVDLKDDENIVVYEVDSDITLLEKKKLVLEHAGWYPASDNTRVVSVQADLTDAAATAIALQKAGLDQKVCTNWIAEGVLEYLNPHLHHKPLFTMAAQLCAAVPRGSCRFGMQILEPKVGLDFGNMGVNLPWNELVDQNVVLQGAIDAGWKLDCVLSEENRDFETMYQRSTNCPGFVMAFLRLG